MRAGPDLGEHGLFNYNNHTIVSHALLNKYDTMLSANESTFHGFCEVMAREYETYASPTPFMGEDRFRTCWFSFMNLQVCDDSFCCEECGEAPRVVVIDGVTLNFQKRKQTSTLKPPTHTCSKSAFHEDVKPPRVHLQLVADSALRKDSIALVRWAMTGGAAVSSEQDMSVDHDQVQAEEGEERERTTKKKPAPPPHNISDVARKLRKVNTTLGDLFARFVPPPETSSNRERLARREWLELLRQVSRLLVVRTATDVSAGAVA